MNLYTYKKKLNLSSKFDTKHTLVKKFPCFISMVFDNKNVIICVQNG